MKQLLLLSLACVFLSQCNSVSVRGGGAREPITKLAIVKNDKIHMEGLQPEIVKQVQAMGISTTLVDAPPPGNEHYMTYTANWAWDMAMFLRYFKADLYQGTAALGSVEYKASGFDMNKFGRTENKVRPLLRQLILNEKPAKKKRS